MDVSEYRNSRDTCVECNELVGSNPNCQNCFRVRNPTPKLTAKLYTDPKLTPEQQELVNCFVLEATSKAFEQAAEMRPETGWDESLVKNEVYQAGWEDGIAAYSDAIRALAKEQG